MEQIIRQYDDSPNINYLSSSFDNIQTTTMDNLKDLTLQNSTESIATGAKGEDIDKYFCDDTGLSQRGLNEQVYEDIDDPIKTLDVADIRGPCGETDCRIAKHMRYYIEDLVEEDSMMVDLDELVGPCGKKSCNFIKNLKDFILHRGVFAYTGQVDEFKRCCCTEQMEKALLNRESCEAFCSQECEDLNRAFWTGASCVHKPEGIRKSFETDTTVQQKTEMPLPESQPTNEIKTQNVQNMYFLTVKLDGKVNVERKQSSTSQSETKKSDTKFKFCTPTCPKSDTHGMYTKSACDITETAEKHLSRSQSLKCIDSRCPNEQEAYTPSPADSDVEIDLNEIRNLCNVQSCDVADKVVDYIVQGLAAKQKCTKKDDLKIFCDCTRCKTNT